MYDQTASAAELKRACRSLGIGASGSKGALYKRLINHMRRRQVENDLSLQEAAKLPERAPRPEPPAPDMPDAETVARHNLTHVPFQKWCPLCEHTFTERSPPGWR